MSQKLTCLTSNLEYEKVSHFEVLVAGFKITILSKYARFKIKL